MANFSATVYMLVILGCVLLSSAENGSGVSQQIENHPAGDATSDDQPSADAPAIEAHPSDKV